MCLVSPTVIAQFVPNSNQVFQFAPSVNPAFSGIERYKDLKMSYRYQWAGFGSDAPKFINLSYNFRLKEPLDLTLHALRTTSGTTAQEKDDIPKIKKSIHGLGFNFFNESVGPVSRLGGGVNYAFHYPLTKTLRLAAGIGAMIDNTKINLDKLYFGVNGVNPDPFYEQLVNNGSNHTELNIRAGVLIYSPRYYVGLSYFPIVYTPLKTSEITVDDAFYKGSVQAGAAFTVSSTIQLKPSILALWQKDNKFAIDYNIKMYIEQKLWFGVSYRDIESMVGILGFNFNELIGASYAYEFSTSGMQQFSDGSHELVLSVRLNNFKRLSPQTW
ncbi:MAG: type IX secretion system membrane protein PorP/SprF [Cyclobacteriaceae bacterium]|nr:type IX secretion system membrane protein PorP/SprF [Cyclobacteriaceae bacterium]MDH4297174.1 type IX secretion system membrane protein PorP/SprF [Cyclobacteriaceae bacterium]MDH5249660.1 type IX secretion system membrane protein PorP/SprF [Cyclobacteriaceae bacterium]